MGLAERLRGWQAPDRVGRYGRQRSWDLQLQWLRRFWFLPPGIVGLSLLAVTPAALYQQGVVRGLLFGAAGACGVWVALLLSTLHSGAGNRLMGAVGEGWTAMDLARLAKRGWVVVNGLQVRRQSDIDHVAVGPAGILVVETKWSADPWPLDGSDTFLTSRIQEAVAQASLHRGHVQGTFAPGRWGVVRAVVVLQSGLETSRVEPHWKQVGEAVVVRGFAFRSWLDTLTEEVLNASDVQRIGDAVRRHVEAFDDKQRERGVRHRRTLSQLALWWVVVPSFTVAAAMSYFVGLAAIDEVWLTIGGLVVGTLVGLWATRVRGLGAIGWPWTLSCLTILLAIGCAEIVSLF